MTGPGTELKWILRLFHIRERAGCGCIELQEKMDDNGPAWCRENMQYIVIQMKREAEDRQLPFSRVFARVLVSVAIRRSERRLVMEGYPGCWQRSLPTGGGR